MPRRNWVTGHFLFHSMVFRPVVRFNLFLFFFPNNSTCMSKIMTSINDSLKGFIEKQHLFFVATAARDGRVNVSPKGMDTLRVLNQNRVVWLNLTGSGNETTAHLLDTNRMTIMFCSFDEMPLILRLYGQAKTIHHKNDGFSELAALFPPHLGVRQIFDMAIDTVQTSCGYGVPFYQYERPRDKLIEWTENKGEDGIKNYWPERNKVSIDGFDTGIGQ